MKRELSLLSPPPPRRRLHRNPIERRLEEKASYHSKEQIPSSSPGIYSNPYTLFPSATPHPRTRTLLRRPFTNSGNSFCFIGGDAGLKIEVLDGVPSCQSPTLQTDPAELGQRGQEQFGRAELVQQRHVNPPGWREQHGLLYPKSLLTRHGLLH